MQVDGETAAWIGIVSSVAGAAGSYFVTREKVNRLEEDVKKLKENQEKFVTAAHLEVVMLSMKEILKSLRDDVGLILERIVPEARNNKNRRN